MRAGVLTERVTAVVGPAASRVADAIHSRLLDSSRVVVDPPHSLFVEALQATVGDEVERDVHTALAERRTGHTRRNLVVMDDEQPVAALTLRRRPTFWEPAAYQVVPGPPVAAVRSNFPRVVRALGVEFRIEAFDGDPSALAPDEVYRIDRYAADLTGDYSAMWPRKSVRTARKKCAGLEVRVDHPGDAEWAVRQWAARFEDDRRGEIAAAPDRLAVWPRLVGTRVHTVALVDGGTIAACTVCWSDGDRLSFECTARDSDYDQRGAGTHALALTFEWAAENGYAVFDLGGGDGYKSRFAPVSGRLWAISFQPRAHRVLRRVARPTASSR